MLDKIIKREKYLERINRFQNQNIIKVITGQRRTGKSYILKSLMADLRGRGVPEKNIIYVNKEDLRFDRIVSYADLSDYIKAEKEKGRKSKRTYIFIDEVQEIAGFEKAIRSLALDENNDIYITGSNSQIISSELSTFLGGRFIETYIAPLDFNEFLQFSGQKASAAALNKYLRYGGLPFIHNTPLNDELVFTYAKNIFNSILLKDVVKKFEIRNIGLLEKLVLFLSNNIGYEFSANSICKYLKNEGVKVSPSVILDYLLALRSGYFVHEVQRFDLKGKRVFKQNAKYYVNDIGIRNAIGGYSEAMINQVIENVVFMHLLSGGFQVYAGYLNGKEVDFVAERNGAVCYIQVAYVVHDRATREREFGNLLEIDDNFRKVVVSMDEAVSDYKGVEHVRLVDFLASDNLGVK